MALTYQRQFELQVERCFECGRFWAHETYGPGKPDCPYCSSHRGNRLFQEKLALERQLIAQRAATTRARQARGGKAKL